MRHIVSRSRNPRELRAREADFLSAMASCGIRSLAPCRAATSRRRGWTLIEAVLAHGMLATIMTVSAVLFVALARSERNAMKACAAQQSLARLQEQFRQDVHRARSAELSRDGADATLSLSDADGPFARYVIAGAELQRVARTAAGDHRESYRFADAAWDAGLSGASPRKARLTLKRPAEGITSTGKELESVVEWRLEGVVGLNPMPVLNRREQP